MKNALKEAEKVTNGQTTEPDKEKADTSELEKVMKEAEELKQEDYTEATYDWKTRKCRCDLNGNNKKALTAWSRGIAG